MTLQSPRDCLRWPCVELLADDAAAINMPCASAGLVGLALWDVWRELRVIRVITPVVFVWDNHLLNFWY
jgi:hypothetical protein